MKKLKKGDVVQLKSGGPRMTVEGPTMVHPQNGAGAGVQNFGNAHNVPQNLVPHRSKVQVWYFDNNDRLNTIHINSICLKVIQEETDAKKTT